MMDQTANWKFLATKKRRCVIVFVDLWSAFVNDAKLSFQMVTHQQRILMIFNSLRIPYTCVDIAAPGTEDETDFMRANAKKKDGQRHVLPPQIFNGEKYCGV